MNATLFRSHFDRALPYAAYLATGTDEQRRRWTQVYDAVTPTDAQRQLFAGFTRRMPVLVISGI